MKLDIKSILILVFLGISIFFGLKWFWSGNDASKERVKQLEQQFKELESQKKAVDLEIESWRSKSDSLKTLDLKLQKEIARQEMLTKKAEQEAQKSKSNLDKMRQDLADTKNKIEQIKSNPPNRTGDDLLESLKNKTKH